MNIDGQVNKVIDQGAAIAKKKIGEAIGGQGAKDKKQEQGIGGMVNDAVTKAAADHAADKAADQAVAFSKKLFK